MHWAILLKYHSVATYNKNVDIKISAHEALQKIGKLKSSFGSNKTKAGKGPKYDSHIGQGHLCLRAKNLSLINYNII